MSSYVEMGASFERLASSQEYTKSLDILKSFSDSEQNLFPNLFHVKGSYARYAKFPRVSVRIYTFML